MERQSKRLLDQQWTDALQGMAKQIQAFKKSSGATQFERALNSEADLPFMKHLREFEATPTGKFIKQAQEFANSPIGKQWAEMAKNVMAANERAKQLSDLIHDASDIDDVQTAIDSIPVDVYTLLALVNLERDKEAGELEKRFQEKSQRAGSHVSQVGPCQVTSRPGQTRDHQILRRARWRDEEWPTTLQNQGIVRKRSCEAICGYGNRSEHDRAVDR